MSITNDVHVPTAVETSVTFEGKDLTIHTHLTRVRDADGFLGTIMYIGHCASAKNTTEVYAGVAWDDGLNRGKHDGSAISRSTGERVRHFSYPKSRPSYRRLDGEESLMFHGPMNTYSDDGGNDQRGRGGCSFMRLIRKQLDFGIELDDDVLRSRYVKENDPYLVAPNNIITGATVRTSRGGTKPIEFVGELKIRKKQQLDRLEEISLRNLGISSISADGTEYGHIQGIDLSGNLLYDWNEVMLLLEKFPSLEELNLSSNILRDIVNDIPDKNDDGPNNFLLGTKFLPHKRYNNMKRLILNCCGISSFRTLEILNNCFPFLEELCATGNNFADIGISKDTVGFENVKLLDLSDCCIPSWENAKRFSSLPSLECLILNDNGIEELRFKGNIEGQNFFFGSLKSLHLVGNNISNWDNLEDITLLPVTSLRFRNNPLTRDMGQSESRSLLIARLSRISFLNSSPVTEKERIDAERKYIRSVGRELLLFANTENEERRIRLLAENPRFEELIAKHKDSMIALGASNEGSILANDTINIKIISMAASSCMMEPVQKRLPCSLKVNRLKSMCARIFEIEFDDISLRFCDPSKVRR